MILTHFYYDFIFVIDVEIKRYNQKKKKKRKIEIIRGCEDLKDTASMLDKEKNFSKWKM